MRSCMGWRCDTRASPGRQALVAPYDSCGVSSSDETNGALSADFGTDRTASVAIRRRPDAGLKRMTEYSRPARMSVLLRVHALGNSALMHRAGVPRPGQIKRCATRSATHLRNL